MNPEILEVLEEAKEELKRSEHLLFVTLKYTRTSEVMKNFLNRLINTYEKGFDSLLNYALEKQRISQIPVAKLVRCNVLTEAFVSIELENYVNFYKTLRLIYKTESFSREEYRRNLTIITPVNQDTFIETSVDDMNLYFLKTQEFIDFIYSIIQE